MRLFAPLYDRALTAVKDQGRRIKLLREAAHEIAVPVGAVRQMIIVCFGSAPGEHRHFVWRLLHVPPVQLGQKVGFHRRIIR